MRKLDFTTYFSTNIDENAKIIFFLENVPRQAKKWPRIRQWQIVTHMRKLITFREPRGLIQMYVIAAVAPDWPFPPIFSLRDEIVDVAVHFYSKWSQSKT